MVGTESIKALLHPNLIPSDPGNMSLFLFRVRVTVLLVVLVAPCQSVAVPSGVVAVASFVRIPGGELYDDGRAEHAHSRQRAARRQGPSRRRATRLIVFALPNGNTLE